MTSVKIVRQRATSRFVRTSRARTSAVTHFGSVRLPIQNESGAFANCRPTPAGGTHAMSFRKEPAVLTLTVRQVKIMVRFR